MDSIELTQCKPDLGPKQPKSRVKVPKSIKEEGIYPWTESIKHSSSQIWDLNSQKSRVKVPKTVKKTGYIPMDSIELTQYKSKLGPKQPKKQSLGPNFNKRAEHIPLGSIDVAQCKSTIGFYSANPNWDLNSQKSRV